MLFLTPMLKKLMTAKNIAHPIKIRVKKAPPFLPMNRPNILEIQKPKKGNKIIDKNIQIALGFN